MNKKTGVIILIIIIGIFAGLYLLGDSGTSKGVTDLTTAKGVDSDYDPVNETTQFSADETVFLVGDMEYPNIDDELYTIWYGPDGEVIKNFEENKVFDNEVWKDSIDQDEDPTDYIYDVYWHIGPQAHSWENGVHSIEIVLNDEVVDTVEFEITDDAQVPDNQTSGSNEVTDLTLSKDFDRLNFDPENETTVFEDDETVWFYGEVQNPVVGMEINTKWYAKEGGSGDQEKIYDYKEAEEENQITLEQKHVGDGSTPIVFPLGTMSQTIQGFTWTTGEHWVELYIDGENVTTMDFQIVDNE